MTDTLNWHDLEIFHAVLEHGSFSAAARALGMSQPTVSRHIEALERKLGQELFVRVSGGLQPSELALDLQDAAADMNEGMFTIRRLLDGKRTVPAGVVTLSIPFGYGNLIVAKTLEGFHDRYPEVSIDLKLGPAQTNLGRREADIDLRWQRPVEPDVVCKALGTFEMGMIASASYLQRHGMPQRAEDLNSHYFPGYEEAITELSRPQFQAFGIQPQRVPVRCSGNHLMALQLAIQGLTLGFTPYGLLPPAMIRVLPRLRFASPDMWLTMHSALRRNAPIRAVWDWLVEHLPAVMAMTRESKV